MLTRRTAVLAARESVYGTDPAMTGANGLLAYDVEIDIKGEVLKRSVLRDTLTPLPHVIGMKEVSLSFKTEMKGNGYTGTAPSIPEIDPLLHACAFATAAIAPTARTYTLISNENSIGSVSLKLYKDGNMHKITGARGTVKFNLEAGKYGVCEWEFQGLYNAVAAATVPDLSGLTANKPPIVYNSSFNIGGFSPVCSALNLDLGNNVVRRDDLNATYGVNSFRISGREGKMEFTPDAVVEASHPFWTNWAGNVVSTFGITIGAGAATGNKLELTGHYEIETNKYGDADGVSQYEVVASLCGSDSDSQNDELTIKFM